MFYVVKSLFCINATLCFPTLGTNRHAFTSKRIFQNTNLSYSRGKGFLQSVAERGRALPSVAERGRALPGVDRGGVYISTPAGASREKVGIEVEK